MSRKSDFETDQEINDITNKPQQLKPPMMPKNLIPKKYIGDKQSYKGKQQSEAEEISMIESKMYSPSEMSM